MITLRQDQMELVEAARDAMKGAQSVLARAPCGAGKTYIASYISHQMAQRGKRLIFTVHRRHLLRQTALTFQKFGIDFGVIAGAARNQNPHANVQIAMMDTLRNRLEQYDADLVIADECHLSASAGHRKVLDHYRAKGSRLLGLSASPKRLDGKPLGDIYDKLVFGRDERWMIDNGILSDYRLIAPVNPALDGVGQNMGDYDKATLARVMDTPDIAGDAIANWRKYADGKRTIGYCVNIAHSQHTTAAFCAAGIAAEHVDGETPDDELRAIIDRFASGQTKILFNCMLMVEGFDLSAQVGHDVPIEALIKLRPTCSTALDVQMNGRALRRKPEPAIILDHAANWEKHGLPCWERDWSLDGKAKSDRGMNIPIRCCAKCLRPYKPAPACPYCGAVPIIKTRQIEHDERVALAEIDKERAHQARKAARKEEGRAKTLAELIELGKKRGYAPGWAIMRWKSRNSGGSVGSGGSAVDKNA